MEGPLGRTFHYHFCVRDTFFLVYSPAYGWGGKGKLLLNLDSDSALFLPTFPHWWVLVISNSIQPNLTPSPLRLSLRWPTASTQLLPSAFISTGISKKQSIKISGGQQSIPSLWYSNNSAGQFFLLGIHWVHSTTSFHYPFHSLP